MKIRRSHVADDSAFSLFSGCTDVQEPYAVVILLEKDLVLIDLAQIG